MDKTIGDKLIKISNEDKQDYLLYKSNQSFRVSEYDNMFICITLGTSVINRDVTFSSEGRGGGGSHAQEQCNKNKRQKFFFGL